MQPKLCRGVYPPYRPFLPPTIDLRIAADFRNISLSSPQSPLRHASTYSKKKYPPRHRFREFRIYPLFLRPNRRISFPLCRTHISPWPKEFYRSRRFRDISVSPNLRFRLSYPEECKYPPHPESILSKTTNRRFPSPSPLYSWLSDLKNALFFPISEADNPVRSDNSDWLLPPDVPIRIRIPDTLR